ncbi:hypothetical protein EG329_003050 [Mollisiaceae sp. DMI_Dod_QoI]|nr:hypothetical protein EG329_003050 [Helotiales sp. DMI_Dod_QoI]
MASPEEAQVALTKQISELDLNKALTEVQNQMDTGIRYTAEDLFKLRPDNKNHNTERVGVAEIGSPLSEGVMTPPYRVCPNPPPPTPATPSNGSNVASSDEATKVATNGIPETALLSVPNGDAPKKKKKKKSSGINRRAGATGFEEFYADAPITPEEHEEETDLYDVSLPFESRIQTCIQRYRARRNLDSDRSNILTKYFMLGGVESGTKAFTGGLDQETIESSTAAEIAALQASDYIRTGSGNAKYYDGSDNWVVDFEGVAKGFLQLYTMVIRNFLNYVLQHRVCEEYTKDVMAARKVCDLAEKELWAIRQLQLKLPGSFNVAASTLYGGRYKDVHMGNAAWAVDDPNYQDYVAADQGFEVPEAERIFKTAIAFAGNDAMFLKVMEEDVEIVKTSTECCEVVGIERPDLKTVGEYSSVKNYRGEPGFIKALGVLKVKHWKGPGLMPEDFTDDEGDTTITEKEGAIESFWLEDDILQLCYVGLKMELDVHELNIGVKFFDCVRGLYCSFHTILPNEKMIYWKEPVPNTRPPPTEDDPEIEERAMEEIAEKDLEEDDKLLMDKE